MEIFILLFLLIIGFLLFVYVPLYLFKRSTTWRMLSLIMSVLISACSFYLIALMTAAPTTVSGNGNLALLVMPFAIASYIGTLKLLYELLREILVKRPLLLIISCGVGIVLLLVGEVLHIQNLIEALGGGPSEIDSRIYRFGWFNQYTNTFYFNGYLFGIGILFVLLGKGIGVLRNK